MVISPVRLRASQGPSWPRQHIFANVKGGNFMRPRLHPDMGEIVLAARVALQLTRLSYDRQRALPLPARDCAYEALREIVGDDYGMLRMALSSLACYLDIGVSSHEWLSTVLKASHDGHTFRRCFHWEYKANRSPYPRVTNRGVQDFSKPATLPRGKGKGQ